MKQCCVDRCKYPLLSLPAVHNISLPASLQYYSTCNYFVGQQTTCTE